MTSPTRPLLRWHGGKWKLAPWQVLWLNPACAAALHRERAGIGTTPLFAEAPA